MYTSVGRPRRPHAVSDEAEAWVRPAVDENQNAVGKRQVERASYSTVRLITVAYGQLLTRMLEAHTLYAPRVSSESEGPILHF